MRKTDIVLLKKKIANNKEDANGAGGNAGGKPAGNKQNRTHFKPQLRTNGI